MSTRSTLAMASEGPVVMHLYHEMHDGEIHLEIWLDPTNIQLNLVIPKPLVDGVRAILCRADDERAVEIARVIADMDAWAHSGGFGSENVADDQIRNWRALLQGEGEVIP